MTPEREAEVDRILNDPRYLVVTFSTLNGDMAIEGHTSYRHLYALGKRSGLFHLAGMIMRPGVPLFSRTLELTYFPPGTARNDLYEFCHVRWQHDVYALITIPAKCRRFAERVAERLRLRIADGVPTVFRSDTGTTPHFFPLRGANVFTLEYAPDFPYEALNAPGGLRVFAAADRASTRELEERWLKDVARN